LRFMAEKLSSLSERALPTDLGSGQDKEILSLRDMLAFSTDAQVDTYRSSPEKRVIHEKEYDTRGEAVASRETLSLETALTQATLLGGFSRLLLQLKQPTNWVNDAWFIVDLQGHCMYMNPVAEYLCHLRSEGMSSFYVNQLISPAVMHAQPGEHIEEVFAKLLPRMRKRRRVLSYLRDVAQGNSSQQELRCDLASEALPIQESGSEEDAEALSGQNESVWRDSHYLLRCYPLPDQQGQLEATVLQMQDITEQVRDEKNRSLLLSGITHDLRTPLTTIKAAVTSLMETKFAWSEEDRQEMLVDIDKETDHLTGLITDLVELSGIEMGALTLEKTWCDVEEVVHGAIRRVDDHILEMRPVDVQVHLPSVMIWCDYLQLQRVFFHLVKNAAHRSPALSPIEVVLEIAEQRKDHLLVHVIDRGRDIPVQERPHIFETFHSLRSYGNGMGLAICKGVIAAFQGQIWVETTEDARTSFSFTIPAHPSIQAGVAGVTRREL
jgi:signal transduction histidine kinase